MISHNGEPLIFNHKNVFLSYIACNEHLIFGYTSQQKYFSTSNDIDRKHSNTYLYFQNNCNTIRIL